jgi:hypothetical protein
MNHVSSAIGIAVLLYLGYIAVAPTPVETLDRTCAPAFQWPKKFLAAGARIFSPSAEDSINKAFDNGFGRCRAWGWGIFYEDEYRKLVDKKAETKAKSGKEQH